MRVPLIAALALTACSSAPPPPGVVCKGTVRRVANDAELSAALAAAAPGDCVLLATGTYTGPITLATRAITVAADEGAIATVRSAQDGLRIDAEGVIVHGLEVNQVLRHGVVIRGPAVVLDGVQVAAAGEAGVMIKCEDSGCMMLTARTVLRDVQISGAAYGLYVDASRASMTGGRITASATDRVGGGAGVYAVRGADLEIDLTQIDHNIYGIIADGAATKVRATDAIVDTNADLGVWGQGLRGTIAAPAMQIQSSRISENGITGLGAFDSAGITVEGGEISRTIEKDVLIDLMNLVRIGDGVGALHQSTEIQISDARLVDNGRAQAVVDDPTGIIRFTATNTISGGLHQVVVQDAGGAMVEVPPGDRSVPPMALPVRAVAFPVPAVVP